MTEGVGSIDVLPQHASNNCTIPLDCLAARDFTWSWPSIKTPRPLSARMHSSHLSLNQRISRTALQWQRVLRNHVCSLFFFIYSCWAARSFCLLRSLSWATHDHFFLVSAQVRWVNTNRQDCLIEQKWLRGILKQVILKQGRVVTSVWQQADSSNLFDWHVLFVLSITSSHEFGPVNLSPCYSGAGSNHEFEEHAYNFNDFSNSFH